MTPAQLRAKAGASPLEVAARMGLSLRAFRALEACPVDAWTLQQLASYVQVLGYRLGVVAVRPSGETVALEVSP